MWINIVAVTYAVYLLATNCKGLNFIELPGFNSDNDNSAIEKELADRGGRRHLETDDSTSDTDKTDKSIPNSNPQDTGEYDIQQELDDITTEQYPPVKTTIGEGRRFWLVSHIPHDVTAPPPAKDMNDKDAILKGKIHTLVLQTLHDIEDRVESINTVKEKHKDVAPYKIGFILSLVKKSRDVLNELFNLAVKHRDETKALEQLKVFELIVHTNVDTTNYVRQLVEIHIQNLNATKHGGNDEKRRVVLL